MNGMAEYILIDEQESRVMSQVGVCISLFVLSLLIPVIVIRTYGHHIVIYISHCLGGGHEAMVCAAVPFALFLCLNAVIRTRYLCSV